MEEVIYSWLFSNFRVQRVQNTLEDVIITVDWRRVAQSDTLTADIYGQVSLTTPDPENFIPFDQITEQQVTDWVVQALTPAQVAEWDASLATNLEQQRNPPVVNLSAPWTVTNTLENSIELPNTM